MSHVLTGCVVSRGFPAGLCCHLPVGVLCWRRLLLFPWWQRGQALLKTVFITVGAAKICWVSGLRGFQSRFTGPLSSLQRVAPCPQACGPS